MISLEVKTDVSSSSPLNLPTPDEEPKLSFSELLKGADKKNDKVIQNGTLVLSLGNDEKDVKTTPKTTTKNDTLLSLLKNEDGLKSDTKEVVESTTKLVQTLTFKDLSEPNSKTIQSQSSKEVLALNPELTQSLTPKELKALISDAKNYLKFKIVNSDEYKKAQIEELPKTLKGLATMAKTIGIEISKVSIEEIQVNKEQNTKPMDMRVKALETKESKGMKESKGSLVLDEKISKTEKLEIKSDQNIPESKKDSIKSVKVANETQTIKLQAKDQDQNIIENKKVEAVKQIEQVKPTLLFKAQSFKEHTTEQIVTVTQFKLEAKTPKEKADDTLKLLLRGEKPSATNSSLTADFSVATAKVIAPSASLDITRSLEKLLYSESSSEQQSGSNLKTETIVTLKSDSFEVKLNEAKQMIKYLSSDVKTAIQDYKSPFTRVKVQLNPQKLGEIDLTIVQRGKNLHVNISSNNSAINTLSMNVNELKTQLTNSGINNATLNFSNSSQNSDSNASEQQQNRHNERKADEEYGYFENEEANEEVLSSLEIIVPQYV